MSESTVLTLDIGGDSGDAVSAVNDVAEAFANLQQASDQISGATDGAASSLDAVQASAGEAGTAVAEAGSNAEGAGGAFEGMGGAAEAMAGSLAGAAGEAGVLVGGLSEVAGAAFDAASPLAAGGAAAAVAAGAFIELATSGADLLTTLMQISATTGLSIEAADTLSLAFEDVGSNASVLIRLGAMLTNTVTQGADAMAKGGDESLKMRIITKDLGVSVFEANGALRDQGAVLEDVLASLGRMTDKTEADRLASELFGARLAGQIIPVINNYDQVMGSATQQAGRLSDGMENGAQKAIAYHTQMTNLKVLMEDISLHALPLLTSGLQTLDTVLNPEPGKDSWLKDLWTAGPAMPDPVALAKQGLEAGKDVGSGVIEGAKSVLNEGTGWFHKILDPGGGGNKTPKDEGHDVGHDFGQGIVEGIGDKRADATAGWEQSLADVQTVVDDSTHHFSAAFAQAGTDSVASWSRSMQDIIAQAEGADTAVTRAAANAGAEIVGTLATITAQGDAAFADLQATGVEAFNQVASAASGAGRTIDSAIAQAVAAATSSLDALAAHAANVMGGATGRAGGVAGGSTGGVAGTQGQMASQAMHDALQAGLEAGTLRFDEGGNIVPAYASGTSYVPRTGLALVHQGEAIIPASQNRPGAGGVTIQILGPLTINQGGGAQGTDGVELFAYTTQQALRSRGVML